MGSTVEIGPLPRERSSDEQSLISFDGEEDENADDPARDNASQTEDEHRQMPAEPQRDASPANDGLRRLFARQADDTASDASSVDDRLPDRFSNQADEVTSDASPADYGLRDLFVRTMTVDANNDARAEDNPRLTVRTRDEPVQRRLTADGTVSDDDDNDGRRAERQRRNGDVNALLGSQLLDALYADLPRGDAELDLRCDDLDIDLSCNDADLARLRAQLLMNLPAVNRRPLRQILPDDDDNSNETTSIELGGPPEYHARHDPSECEYCERHQVLRDYDDDYPDQLEVRDPYTVNDEDLVAAADDNNRRTHEPGFQIPHHDTPAEKNPDQDAEQRPRYGHINERFADRGHATSRVIRPWFNPPRVNSGSRTPRSPHREQRTQPDGHVDDDTGHHHVPPSPRRNERPRSPRRDERPRHNWSAEDDNVNYDAHSPTPDSPIPPRYRRPPSRGRSHPRARHQPSPPRPSPEPPRGRNARGFRRDPFDDPDPASRYGDRLNILETGVEQLHHRMRMTELSQTDIFALRRDIATHQREFRGLYERQIGRAHV